MASVAATDLTPASPAHTPPIALQRPGIPPLPVCRLAVEQYEEMVRTGIIAEDEPVELLDGWLVQKMPKNPPHVVASELVRNALSKAVSEGWCAFSQQPVRLAASVPEPDVMVVRGDVRQYANQLPRANDVGLLIEVADSSLSRDQVFKKTIYAQAGIPVYWLVNLLDRRVEVYTDSAGADEKADYRQRRDYSADAEIPLVLDGRVLASIPVGQLLP